MYIYNTNLYVNNTVVLVYPTHCCQIELKFYWINQYKRIASIHFSGWIIFDLNIWRAKRVSGLSNADFQGKIDPKHRPVGRCLGSILPWKSALDRPLTLFAVQLMCNTTRAVGEDTFHVVRQPRGRYKWRDERIKDPSHVDFQDKIGPKHRPTGDA